MQYISTRGGETTDFTGTILTGLAKDGGLFAPQTYPHIPVEDIAQFWRGNMTYTQVAFYVMRKLAPDLNSERLYAAIKDAYAPNVFCNAIYGSTADIIPVRKLNDDYWLTDLNAGPTLAFKDVAMQLLAGLFEIALEGRPMNILGATSGDTGSAAIHAMQRVSGINTFILSPAEGMSPFQAYQMRSVIQPNVVNLAVRGDFDAAQAAVKAVFVDPDFKAKFNLGAVNSINWARVAAQVVYYFWSYSKADQGKGQEVDFAVPTGNFGNIYAAFVAKQMGLPIGKLILATNENDVLHEFFTTGIYKPRSRAQVTISPSMDITAASNFERFIFHLMNGDATVVQKLYESLGRDGQFDLSDRMSEISNHNIVSFSSTEIGCTTMMEYVHGDHGVMFDPHTAVALSAAQHHARLGVPMMVMSTANPCKFNDTVEKVLGASATVPEAFTDWENAEQEFLTIDPDPDWIKEVIAEHVSAVA